MMPNQSLLYAGRVQPCAPLHDMMHLTRELCGGQLSLTPSAASFANPDTAAWLEKYYTLTDDHSAEDRRKLMAFARDLISSDHASHRLAHSLFGQSPPFEHLASVYHHFDWDGPLAMLRDAAGLEPAPLPPPDLPKTQDWFSPHPPLRTPPLADID